MQLRQKARDEHRNDEAKQLGRTLKKQIKADKLQYRIAQLERMTWKEVKAERKG